MSAAVDAYLSALPPDQSAALRALRATIRAHLPGATECMSYAMPGFRPNRLQFGDIPLPGHRGSALGGTGIAVSAFATRLEAARDYAYWVASAEVQASLYAASGGQPGHAAGWDDAAVNAATHDFYRATRTTLENAYVRPRHHGYMAFQDAASRRIGEALAARHAAAAVLDDLDRMYEESF